MAGAPVCSLQFSSVHTSQYRPRVQPMQFLPYFLTKGENHLLSFQPHSPFLPVARIELFRFSGSWLSTDSTQKNDFIRSLSPDFMRKSRYSDLLLAMFWNCLQYHVNSQRMWPLATGLNEWLLWADKKGSWHFQFFLESNFSLDDRKTSTAMLDWSVCVSDLTSVLFTGSLQAHTNVVDFY